MTKANTKTPSAKKAKAAARPGDGGQAAAAYEAIRADAEALTPDQLATINVDIPLAVSVVLGAIPNLVSLRDAVVEELPAFDIANIDRLTDYALGAWYAHLVALPASNGPTEVAALDAEAIPLRENLLADAEALARRGLLDFEAVAHIRTGQGQVDRATDLVALSALFSAHWDDVKTKTAATEAEVARAGELGPLLLNALGVRRSGQPVDAKESAFMRARCFTLFFRAYDQCRRAVSYLRWSDGDADRFAPSLYAGRGGRTASGPAPEPQPANPPAAVAAPELPAPAPASSPVAQPAPAKPAS